ncbi:LysE family translocator [uncultured Shewanella sp.]|uniref:LysE family translocator n=1 Tax=uncultured Shewanella sp. TaxID=173975 RepID=UPI00260BF9F7|nr:LysE family translocator [uncultured Shewanella sp.]
MDIYLVYIGVAMATISLPGPAVLLTINNSIQKGLVKAISGILGVALGILLIALISATGLGVLLEQSVVAFTILKFVGAAYLVYLGLKMLRDKSEIKTSMNTTNTSTLKCFFEGFMVSTSNPKAIIFFISILPQFIDKTQDYSSQLFILAVTFSILVIIIHMLYAIFAVIAKSKLLPHNNKSLFNKISGSIFISFGIGLAASSR